MNKNLILLIVGAVLSAQMYGADVTDSSANNTYVPVPIIRKNDSTMNNPKSPSRQHIECWYESGTLTFDFAISEGDCELTLTSGDGTIGIYSFDSSSTAQVYVGDIWNIAIEIHTGNGHWYEGWLGSC